MPVIRIDSEVTTYNGRLEEMGLESLVVVVTSEQLRAIEPLPLPLVVFLVLTVFNIIVPNKRVPVLLSLGVNTLDLHRTLEVNLEP